MVTCSTQKEQFFAACQAQECQPFLEILEKHRSKSDDFNISDLLLSFSKKQHEKIWTGLFDLCARTLAKLNPSADPIEQCAVDEVIQCLQGIVTVGVCCLELKKPVTVAKMLETMIVLHGVLLDLPDSASKLQHNIAKLCQTWWTAGLADRELLVPNTIMYLLVRTLQPNGTKAEVKLLTTMRESFLQVKLADESSASLKSLLEQCIISPTYLKYDEGRKFLSFVFCLDVSLVECLHQAIKNQLPSCPKSLIDSYGEVYFKAWRNSTGPVTLKIETHCIQDLMHCAIHARRVGARNLALALRQLLSYFTKQKRLQGVDKMLLDLYAPILWRAFKVANASVRANAAALLIDAFPLQDPEAKKEDTDALLQKQVDILQGFLYDPCPVVRVTAIQGICRIMGMFWELIPSHVLTTFLTKLVQDLAFDVSSNDVRVAVFKGLVFVVDNPLSLPLLKNLLPSLKDFIHDTSELVVVAFLELLLKVRGLKTIKVWSIVPVEDLLARLELDSPPVARRLVSLLFKSFQPTDRDPSVQVERVMALITMNPGAARVFYQYAHKHMSVATAADFMLLLGRCVQGCINQAHHHSSLMSGAGDSSAGNEETGMEEEDGEEGGDREKEEEEEEEGLSLKDTEVIDGMLEIMAILWTGIAQQLAKPVNQSVSQKLRTRFSKYLPKFLSTFQDGRSLSAVLALAAFLPSSSIPAFSHSCRSKLKSLSPTASPDAYGPLLQCLVSWGKGNDVIVLISDWLEAAMKRTGSDDEPAEEQEEEDRTKMKERKVTFTEPLKPQPGLALAYLDWLLTNYSSRTLLLDASTTTLRDMVTTLKLVLRSLEKRLLSPGPVNDLVTDDMLVSILQAYCRISIHLESLENAEPASPTDGEPCGVSARFDELLAWCDRELLPVLPQGGGDENGMKSATDGAVKKLAMDSLKAVLKMSCDVVMLGFGSDEFQSHLANFCHLVLQTDENLEFVPVIAKAMCQLGRGGSAVDARQQDVVADLFSRFIKAVGGCAKQEERDTTPVKQTLTSIKPAVSDILRQANRSSSSVQTDPVVATMAACVGEMTDAVAKSEGTMDPALTPADLPLVSGFLLGVVCSNRDLLRSFVYELEHCLSVGAMQTYPALLAALHLLYPLCQARRGGAKGGAKGGARGAGCGIKECLVTIQQQKEKLAGREGKTGEDMEEEKGLNDPQRFMLEQMQAMETEISQAIGGVA